MKSNILTIMKKEFARFFRDKGMVFSTLIMPGLIIYLMYSVMGSAIGNMVNVANSYQSDILIVNQPASMETLLGSAEIRLTEAQPEQIDFLKSGVENKQHDLLLVFPADFDQKVAAYDAASGQDAPDIRMYYNSTRKESSAAQAKVLMLLNAYETKLANKFDVNRGEDKFDMATSKDGSGMFMSMVLPMLLLMFIFSGCMGIAPESIAGEKERGTIATLLVTPAKRSDIAVGKILSLSAIAMLAGVSSFTGTILSLPKMLGKAGDMVDSTYYGVQDYILLLLLIFTSALLIVGMISIISTLAKSVKQATTYVMPLMLIIMLVGISSMLNQGAQTNNLFYLLPLYNSTQSMVGIFSFNYNPIHIAITLVSNLIYAGACAFVLTKMFDSERIIYT